MRLGAVSMHVRSGWENPWPSPRPTQVELRRAGGQNLLFVGQEEDLIENMMSLTIVTTCRVPPSEGPSLTLLHSGRNPDTGARFTALAETAELQGFEIGTSERATDIIREYAAAVARREEQSELADTPARSPAGHHNIRQFRELRREEDDFSLGSFGEPKVKTTASMLGEIIRRGPLVGIHTVVWADTFSNAMLALECSVERIREPNCAEDESH